MAKNDHSQSGDPRDKVEDWFNRRNLVLDLANLTEEQRRHCSFLLGGSGVQFVQRREGLDYRTVSIVVFNWGDSAAEDVFAAMLEHDDNPSEPHLLPFTASTVIGDQLWSLVVQRKDFDLRTAYRSSDYYFEVPFDQEQGSTELYEHLGTYPASSIEILGKVGTRWVLFEMGMDLEQD